MTRGRPGGYWRLESYFSRQTRILDELISDILSHERMVNDSQTLAHYSRILMAILEAKEIGRLPDHLTDSRIKALMEIIPRKESNYWRQDQVGVRPKDMPVAFYSFIRARALELGSNAASMRVVRDDLDEQGPVWEGPCMIRDLWGGSHTPERCSLFMDLSPEDRLVVVQKKRLCYLCFRHADDQPCTLQSLPACSVGGCVRMHSKLLHEALQKEETRAIVIEVEEGPEEPGENEEFYAANFELLGQEDEDKEGGVISEDEAPPLVDSDEEPDEEPSPFAHLGEDRPPLCQQRVPLEVNGNLTSLHTLYDWESTNTLVRKESARRIGLQGVRAPRQAIRGYQGEGLITDSVYYLPLLDVDGNIQVIRAYGVDEIAVVARTRLPPVAREIFPVIRAYMPWMETGAGQVELLIGLDNRQWLPAHVEDSWDPNDDMRLMRSAFGYRYMTTDGWGRDLFPPDNTQDGQAGAQGGGAEPVDAAQEVQLEENRGWSQGTWSGENGGVQEAVNPGGGCLGARPKDRGRTTTQGAPVAQRKASQGGGSRGPGRACRDPPVPPAPFGMPYSQVGWGARPRPREIPPPKRRPSTNPSPAWSKQLEPRRVGQGKARPRRSNQGTAAAQAAPSRPRKVARTPAADRAGGPGAKACPHDGGDDARHAASEWLPR